MQRHPPWILALTALVTVVMAGGLARLEFKSSEDTMIPSGSTIYTDNVRYQHRFGTDPMIIVFTGDRGRLLSGHNLHELRRAAAPACSLGPVPRRAGPAAAVRFAADQLSVAPKLALDALVRDEAQAKTPAARNRLAAEFQRRTQSDATRFAAVGPQTIDNPEFVKFLVEDSAGNVRPSLEGVFPDPPLLVEEINDRLRGDMALLGGVAALVMAVVLLLVFRVRWRLLSLGVMALGVVWAFGLLGYLGIPLMMVTISGLPILIGLGVDFAVQIHSRYEEELALDPDGDVGGALLRMFLRLGPAITVAAVAAVAGFLALRTSDVPMVRDFGVLLSVGVLAVFAAAVLPLPAILGWRDRRVRQRPSGGRRGPSNVSHAAWPPRARTPGRDPGRVSRDCGAGPFGLWASVAAIGSGALGPAG